MSSFDTNADFTIARLQAQLELSLKREAELEALLEEALEIMEARQARRKGEKNV